MTQLQIRDLTPEFGAEIEGLDPRALDEEQCRLLRSTFDDRGLLVFRNLDLSVDDQTYLAYMLIGESVPAVDEAPQDAGEPKLFVVSNKEPGAGAPFGRLLFHSDMMWSDNPFRVLSLYGLDVEQPAVPTSFVSTSRAWDALPDELRARVDGLHAIHETGQQTRGGYDDAELLQPIREQVRMSTSPVGSPHPRTGRVRLYVCQMMTREIVELPAEESEALLEELFSYLYDPAHVLEHEWRNGDLVAWDNLAIQHARPDVRSDGPARTLRKVIAPKPVMADRPETPKFSNAR